MEDMNKYKSIFNHLNDAVYIHTLKENGLPGPIREVNDKACQMLGYTHEEFLKMKISDIDSSDSTMKVPVIMEKLLQHKSVVFEMEHVKKNGEKLPVEINAKVIQGSEGKMIVSIVRDISQRKKAEEVLKLNQEIISTINDPMAVIDKNYTYKMVNKAYSDFHHTKMSEVIGKKVEDSLERDFFETVVKPKLEKCFSSEQVSYSTWVDFPNGDKKFMAMNYFPYYSAEGEVIGVISHGKDLTNEKLLALSLEESQTLFRSIVNTMPGTLNVMDPEYNLLALNENRIKLDLASIQSPDELLGKKCYEVFQKRQTPCPWCKIDNVLKTGEAIIETTTPDDPREKLTGRAIQVFLAPVKNKDGKTLGVIEYGLDVTELRNAQMKAEQLAENKSSILANMSHEIKNQLNGIIGFSEMLKNMDLDEEKQMFANNIVRSGKALLKIVNDSLIISKMEAGKLEIKLTDTEITALVKQSLDIIRPQASEKGNIVEYVIGDDVPAFIQMDPLRVSQVLINLLTNANKFTKKGHITLKVEKADEKDNTVRIIFSVIDTGIGIRKEQQDKIFKVFEQAGHHTPEESEGTGLGLSISNSILNLMGSQLHLESVPMAGSVFSFELNVEKSNKIRTPYPNKIKNMKVGLIADDDEVSRMLAEMLLKEIIPGVKLIKAVNGKQALEAYELHHPDFILMDVQMPLMDGLEVTQHIRTIEPENKRIKIIGYSAAVYNRDIQKALTSGMDGYINKPVVKDDLIRVLKNG